MATTCYLRDSSTYITNFGRNDANLAGTNVGWVARDTSTTRGAASTTKTVTTVAGTTLGIELKDGAPTLHWLTPPLDADVTISGTITFNIRGQESSMSANSGLQVVIERVTPDGTFASTICNSERGTELGTSDGANNWTVAPTSTACTKGDRLRIRVAANDAGGTMGTGFTVTVSHDGPTAAAAGDTYVTFDETVTFSTTDPTTTQVFLTNTSAGIDPGASTELEAWTSRGAGLAEAIVNTVAGWVAPIQWTDSGGGTVIEWYSKQLQGFTLDGLVKAQVRIKTSDGIQPGIGMLKISVCASDGSGATDWATAGSTFALDTNYSARIFYIRGAPVTITNGQRLRFRFFLDDSFQALRASQTGTLGYASTAGSNGDSFVWFPATLTEYTSTPVPRHPAINHSNPGLL